MAILSYMSVNCASTPLSQDSTTSTPPPSVPLPTKVILPSKKPQKWSTGVAPGEYGGPPTTTKLRKYWGGDKEDPITSDDLIWNRDFMTRMNKLFEDEEEDATSIESSSTKQRVSTRPNIGGSHLVLVRFQLFHGPPNLLLHREEVQTSP